MGEASDLAPSPRSLGFLGVGVMGSAIVRGVCRAAAAGADSEARCRALVKFPILLGPPSPSRRGLHGGAELDDDSAQARLLAELGPGLVRVLESSRALLGEADVVVLGVRPPQLGALLEELAGGEAPLAGAARQERPALVNLLSTVPSSQLLALLGERLGWAAPESEAGSGSAPAICKCVPLPAVQHRQGTTVCAALEGAAASEALLRDFCLPLFSLLGTAVACREAQLPVFQAVTAMMGPLYQHGSWLQQWMQAQQCGAGEGGAAAPPVDADTAQKYVASFLRTVLADVGTRSFAECAGEQTPGGLNEMAMRRLAPERQLVFDVLGEVRDRVESQKPGPKA